VPSVQVAPPRLAEAPVALECTLDRIIEIGNEPSFAVLGRVVLIHAREDVIDDRGYMDPQKLRAIARMGGSLYSTTHDTFKMERPVYTP
jgi:flavin reductase (DIM6/NTAB) family NADH-FMN oxidoreductase RutF